MEEGWGSLSSTYYGQSGFRPDLAADVHAWMRGEGGAKLPTANAETAEPVNSLTAAAIETLGLAAIKAVDPQT